MDKIVSWLQPVMLLVCVSYPRCLYSRRPKRTVGGSSISTASSFNDCCFLSDRPVLRTAQFSSPWTTTWFRIPGPGRRASVSLSAIRSHQVVLETVRMVYWHSDRVLQQQQPNTDAASTTSLVSNSDGQTMWCVKSTTTAANRPGTSRPTGLLANFASDFRNSNRHR